MSDILVDETDSVENAADENWKTPSKFLRAHLQSDSSVGIVRALSACHPRYLDQFSKSLWETILRIEKKYSISSDFDGYMHIEAKSELDALAAELEKQGR